MKWIELPILLLYRETWIIALCKRTYRAMFGQFINNSSNVLLEGLALYSWIGMISSNDTFGRHTRVIVTGNLRYKSYMISGESNYSFYMHLYNIPTPIYKWIRNKLKVYFIVYYLPQIIWSIMTNGRNFNLRHRYTSFSSSF